MHTYVLLPTIPFCNCSEFAELESCYDDILKNMPDGYMQTVQLLEQHLCDLHISEICECSSVSAANQTILECLTENAVFKEHLLDFCERLLQIRNASNLTCIVENLRECKYQLYFTGLCLFMHGAIYI